MIFHAVLVDENNGRASGGGSAKWPYSLAIDQST
jgi:hypothetical protein